jgi:hypothetical protein
MKLNKSILSGLSIILAISGLSAAGIPSKVALTDGDETTSLPFDGKGTADDPYQIKTVEDLKALSTASSSLTFDSLYFKLMNDIDVKGDTAFVGISADGNTAHNFNGVFDGNNHVIDNIVLNKVAFDETGKALSTSSTQYCGFIGRLGTTGVIKNLTIGKGSVMNFWMGSGAIAGYVAGRIENCTNQGTVIGYYSNIGGIAGSVLKVKGVVSHCHNEGTVIGGYQYIGGIAGQVYGTIEYCQNDGKVYAKYLNPAVVATNAKNVGGIGGYVSGGTINYCVNNGDVYTQNANAGGIVAYLLGSTSYVRNNINTGYISSETPGQVVGGIVAYSSTAAVKEFTNNFYDAQIGAEFGAFNRDAKDGATGLSTAEFTSGKVLGSLSSDTIKFVKGSYPVLADFAESDASKALSQLVVTLPDDVTVADVKGTATLSNLEGQSWTLKKNSSVYTIAAGSLTVGEITGSDVINDTLIASSNGFIKEIPIKSVPVLFEGQGTEASPYLIKTNADLKKLATQVNSNLITYEGYYFKLTSDLDFTDDALDVIASGNAQFAGVFDGDNHVISNLNFNETNSKATQNIALFGTVKETGVIKNLTLKDGTYTTAAALYMAGFVVTLNGTVENCVNYNTINGLSAGKYSAGVVYEVKGTGQVLNCKNYGAVSSKSGGVGGIVSTIAINGLVKGSENYGTIASANTSNGGIAGKSAGHIEECTNYADLSIEKSYFGGIVGYTTDSCYVINSANRGNLTLGGTAQYIGGIVGQGYGKTKIISSNNYGIVKSASTSAMAYVGGIIAKAAAGCSITDSNNYNEVIATGAYIGGIAGYITAGTAAKGSGYYARCYNYANITSTKYDVGGFGGYVAALTDIIDCGNYGDIKSEGYNVAGFNGYGAATTYTRCFNVGNVSNNSYFTSGFTGNGSKSVYTDCFNTGNVITTGMNTTSDANVSAAGMLANGGATFINCYSLGTVSAPDKVAGFVAYTTATAPDSISNCYVGGKVIATNSDASAVSPFMGTNLNNTSSFENNYYNSDSITIVSETAQAVGKTTKELTEINLGDGYVNIPATLPYHAWAKNIPQATFAAAQIAFETAPETPENVLNNIKLGLPEGVTWTSSENLKIEDGVAIVPAEGGAGQKATLTKAAGESLSKTYDLVLNNASGVNSINAQGKDVKARRFFNISGQEVSNPSNGDVVIEQTIFNDGSSSVRKVTVKE